MLSNIQKQQIILINYMAELEFDTICRLGQGTYGDVYKVRRRNDGRQYALKRVKIMKLKDKDKKNTLNEVRILASVDHPNIVQYRQAIFDEQKGELALVMELAHGGDLADKIKSRFQRGQNFRQEEIWRWGSGILEGLKCLHSLGVVHRDIKPANILFTLEGTPLLGDLNVARELVEGLAHSQTGTPNYASPEIWDNLSYGAQCDIWSFGCIIYELCCFRPPFRSKSMEELYQRVKSCRYDPIPRRYSVSLESVIDRCLKKSQQRVSLDELIKLFSRHTITHPIRRSQSAGTLLKKIDVPKSTKDVSALLPSARYAKQQYSNGCLNPEEIAKKQPISNFLERFMKDRSSLVPKQRKLNNKIYTQQAENMMKPCRSEAHLPYQDSRKKEEQQKMISFRDVLDSLQNAKISDRLSKVGLRKRNIRYGLRLFE